MTFFRLLAALISIAACMLASGTFAQVAIPGKNFREIPRAVPSKGKPEVLYFFLYRCPHCMQGAGEVDAWQMQLRNSAAVRSVPLIFSEMDQSHASMHYALQSLGKLDALHAGIFRSVLMDKKLLATAQDQAAYFEPLGIAPSDYLKAAQSPAVLANVARARRESQNLSILSAPSIAIANQYVTDTELAGGLTQALQVSSDVVNRIVSGKSASLSQSSANAAAQTASGTSGSKSAPSGSASQRNLCDLMLENWTDRQRTESREKYPFLNYLRVSSDEADRLVHEFDASMMRSCAKDEEEFQKRAKWMLSSLQSNKERRGVNCGGLIGNGSPLDNQFKGLFNNEYIRNYGCDIKMKLPNGFATWFDKYKQDARAALEWARAKQAGGPGATQPDSSPAEQACAASLKSIGNQLEAAQRSIAKDSVVVLSEATLWATAESIAKIKVLCPQSARYQAEIKTLEATYKETKRACDSGATRPCMPRLPGAEPVPAPVPTAEPLKPLENKPPAPCESGTGANWLDCERKLCSARGGQFSFNKCAACYIPGNSWTHCPKGSGGVSSAQ